MPDNSLSCPKRERSTTAPQALAMLNASEVTEAAKALAARLDGKEPTPTAQIEAAYRKILGRRPAVNEVRAAREFLGQSPLSEFCRALFSLNEFVYLD